jgi:hypothetical protein
MIRKGRMEDIPKIFIVGQKLREKYYKQNVPMDRQQVFKTLSLFIRSPQKILLVADHGGPFRGFLMADCQPFWDVNPRSGRRYVTDWAFYSEMFGDGRKMLKIATEWAWSQPRVINVLMGTQIPQSDATMDRLFCGAGFERVGRMYRMEKPQGD